MHRILPLTFQRYILDIQEDFKFINMKFVLVIGWIFLLGLTANAQILENYESRISYRNSDDLLQISSQAVVPLDLVNFPKSSFRLHFPGGSTVFLNQSLWFHTSKDTILLVPLGDVAELAGGASSADMTVLSRRSIKDNVSVLKGYFRDATELNEEEERTILDFTERKKTDWNDFFILALIIVFFLFAVHKIIFPLVLNHILSPKSLVTADDFSDSGSLQKFFSIDVIFYLLILNMLAMVLGMLAIRELGRGVLMRIVEGDLNQLFLYWIFGSLILMLVTVAKFIFLKIMVTVFGLRKFEFTHFFYLLRVISICLVVGATISLYTYLNHAIYLNNFVNYCLTGFFWVYLLGMVTMFAIMANRIPFKNYHLFAYICTAELIPFLIISKMIIG